MYRSLTFDEEVILNQFSQRILSLDDVKSWFLKYSYEEKKNIVYGLLCMVIQSNAVSEDVYFAATYLKKVSSSAAVMLLNPRKPFYKFGYDVCRLPEKDLDIAFCILLVTLSISDNRRKQSEPPHKCNHWWHKDLSDEKYINKIRTQLDG